MRQILQSKIWFFSIMGILFAGWLMVSIGLDYWQEKELAAIPNQPKLSPRGKIALIIKVPARILEVYENGMLYKKYQIAVGKSDTPSPIGEWFVVYKSYRPGDVFGTRFLALNVPWGGYGIHGTNQPWSIGHYASHGCIRMRNKDVEELFEWTPVGTPVRIEGQSIAIKRVLKLHTMGADVVQLQLKLKTIGYLEGRADGFFNADTDIAIKRLQHDKGLKPNGIVDRETLNRMGL